MQSTQNQLIHLLSQNNERYISNFDLANNLDITQNELSKHIQTLEKAGYKFAETNKGYKVIQYPDQLNEHFLRQGLQTDWIGQTIIHKETTASTQVDAHELAKRGAPHGTIVVADKQTDGRGRMNRYWHSSNEKGIWLSLILRPNISPYLTPQFTLLTATVLADVFKSYVQVEPQIKWPNDLLIKHQKVAGILTELQAERNQVQYIVIGMGINVNHKKLDLPEEKTSNATSLQIETGKQWSKRYLIQAILQIFEQTFNQLVTDGFEPIKHRWEQYGYKLGEQILVNNFKQKWQTTFVGIASDGALLTKQTDKDIKKIYSAEIEWYNDT